MRFWFVCLCYVLAGQLGSDKVVIARTAQTALTKSSSGCMRLQYLEKCSNNNSEPVSGSARPRSLAQQGSHRYAYTADLYNAPCAKPRL